jgi:hypothetical protein
MNRIGARTDERIDYAARTNTLKLWRGDRQLSLMHRLRCTTGLAFRVAQIQQ